MTKVENSRKLQLQKTRSALISAARRLFAEKGYYGTGTHEIVAEAGVSRGALQHHFPIKEDLFRAVFEAVERDMLEHAAMRDIGPDPIPGKKWQAFRHSIHDFLKAAADSEIQRIILLDGPSVMGWPEWRHLETHYGLSVIGEAVSDGIAAKLIRPQVVEPLAHLILAAIDEAALIVAHSKNPPLAIKDVLIAIDTLLMSLEG